MAHLDGFEANSYLKSGANELRVLEYNVCGMSFGINILKVKKIVSHMNQFMSMPESHAAIRGVFEERGNVVPLIDLAFFLGIPRDEDKPPEKVIITEFFEMQNGFWVDRIDWIHHFKWEDVIDAAGVMHGFDQKYVIGIVKPSEDKMILLLDYENIILDICPQLRRDTNEMAEKSEVEGRGRRILVAEDSPAIRNMLATELSEVGFEVEQARDGHEGWEKFQETKEPYDLVISDVEMPRMDGLALTVAIRGSEQKDTPVIVYSSIGDIGMKARANFLKANAHITKLNFEELLLEVDKMTRDKGRIEVEADNFEESASDDLILKETEDEESEKETASEEPQENKEETEAEPAEDKAEEEPEEDKGLAMTLDPEEDKSEIEKPKAEAKPKKSASKSKAGSTKKRASNKKSAAKASTKKKKSSTKKSTAKSSTAKKKSASTNKTGSKKKSEGTKRASKKKTPVA
ncbi:MAG: response regulator [candidate division Zixibacteria bacterium]|nr:response regulator [candidate division Zixibacteria bacterium]